MVCLEALPRPDNDLNGRIGYVLRYLGPGFRAEERQAFSISGAGCCKDPPPKKQKNPQKNKTSGKR